MSQPEKIQLTPPSRPRIGNVIAGLPPSGIREFFELVIGRDDITSLGVGEPDFVTPWRISEAAIYSIHQGQTSYTSNSGLLSLRTAIARYLAERFSVEADPVSEILITVGASEGMDLALRAILNPGDEVIVPEPCYVAYDPLVRLAGGVPRTLPTRGEDGFRIDWNALESLIGPKTRAIIVNYPSNPTGVTLKPEEVERLANLAASREIIVISDEIYAELTYIGEHVSLASFPQAADWTILLSGFSKAFAMTGWRLGYATGPAEIVGAMTKIHQYSMLCAPIMAQRAAEAALSEGMDDMRRMVESYGERRNYFDSGLKRIGLRTTDPEGAFYAFPCIAQTGLTSMEFCKRLLQEESLAVVPGTAFGASGEGYFRASYAVDFATLDRALEKLDRFLSRL
jgi:aminotransferase